MLNKIISHYKILEKLGGGGMGVVYKALDTKLQREVALKFLPPSFSEDDGAKSRFIQEAQSASALRHDSICTIHAIEETDNGQLFISMDLYQGETLKKKIAKGPIELNEAIEITIQIAKGLTAAHEKGIIHRDVKPANIFITNNNEVKVLDFGLAKRTSQKQLTQIGSTLGTVAYMSPEQARGEEVDKRTDIWSLGVVLYEMLKGSQPFKGEYDQGIIYSIINEEPESQFSEYHKMLQRIIEKCLRKNKSERYNNTIELIKDLKSLRDELVSAVKTEQVDKKKSGKLLISILLVTFIALFTTIFILNPFKTLEEKVNVTSEWKNSIAVLPFNNISNDTEHEYFCDGMTEQIITNLSQLKNLKVIARTSVMKFKNTKMTIPEIAKELGVTNILEGSVRKAGNRIRVTAQLIEAEDGHHIWANDFDRQLEDIFEVQDDVSEAIASALFKELTMTEANEIKTKRPDNIEAYEYFLKGVYFHDQKYLYSRDLDDLKKAESFFKKAIGIDDNYAIAHAELANLYNTLFNYSSDEDERQKYLIFQVEFIDKALDLDQNSSNIHTINGYIHTAKDEEEKAYQSFKQALLINPNNPKSNYALGGFLESIHLTEKAKKYYSKAIELNPLDSRSYWKRAICYRSLGEMQNSIKDYKAALEIEPNFPNALNGICKSLMVLGKYDEAEEYLSQSEKLNPDFIDTKQTRAFFMAGNGQTEAALKLLEKIDKVSRYNLIVINCLSDNKEEAINYIDGQPWSSYLDIINFPGYEIIRDTEEYNQAVRKAKTIYEENMAKYGDDVP